MADNVFNVNYQDTFDLCNSIIKNRINIKWTCYFHPHETDKELVHFMKNAGCESVSIGIDNASEEFVDEWDKGFSVENLKSTKNLSAAL
jgi:radical SAM superfamily enzyme YgiQ (UPF0313 family)